MNNEELKRWVTTRTDNCLSQAGLQVLTGLKWKHHTIRFKLFYRDHYEGSKGLGQIKNCGCTRRIKVDEGIYKFNCVSKSK